MTNPFMNVTPDMIGSIIGAAVVTGGTLYVSIQKWVKPNDKKLDKVIAGMGAGNGGPTLVSLVLSTQQRINTIGSSLENLHDAFTENIKSEQVSRDENLAAHKGFLTRIENIENFRVLAVTTKEIADLLAIKTANTAKDLHIETAQTAKDLRDETVKTAKALAKAKAKAKADNGKR